MKPFPVAWSIFTTESSYVSTIHTIEGLYFVPPWPAGKKAALELPGSHDGVVLIYTTWDRCQLHTTHKEAIPNLRFYLPLYHSGSRNTAQNGMVPARLPSSFPAQKAGGCK